MGRKTTLDFNWSYKKCNATHTLLDDNCVPADNNFDFSHCGFLTLTLTLTRSPLQSENMAKNTRNDRKNIMLRPINRIQRGTPKTIQLKTYKNRTRNDTREGNRSIRKSRTYHDKNRTIFPWRSATKPWATRTNHSRKIDSIRPPRNAFSDFFCASLDWNVCRC
jgi:hypothetical protein